MRVKGIGKQNLPQHIPNSIAFQALHKPGSKASSGLFSQQLSVENTSANQPQNVAKLTSAEQNHQASEAT